MTPTEVTAILRQFNDWRRCDYEPSEQPAPPDPCEIGEAIDAAVEMIDRLEAAEKERDDVAQQLVQSEIGKRDISEAHNAVTGRLSVLADENTALRAKVDAMEKQEPVAWWGRGPRDERIELSVHKPAPSVMRDFAVTPLYALPGAKGEEK